MNTWNQTKRDGDEAEKRAAAFYRRLGLDVIQTSVAASYDLRVCGDFEIKNDRLANSTGNLVVEISYRDKPSGIKTSTATTWWFVIDDDEALIVRLADLRQLIATEHFTCKAAGDYGRATVLLVPIERMRRIAYTVSSNRRLAEQREPSTAGFSKPNEPPGSEHDGPAELRNSETVRANRRQRALGSDEW